MILRHAIVALALATVATAADKPTVRVSWERATDFSKYRTCQWLEGTRAVDDEANQMIVQAVDDQLGVNGIFKEVADPDLYVVYHAAEEESFEVSGGYRRDWQDTRAVTVNSHVAGTLVIDLVDAEENQLVWRAYATATITDDRNKDRRTVRDVLTRMFANFPPKKMRISSTPPRPSRPTSTAQSAAGRVHSRDG